MVKVNLNTYYKTALDLHQSGKLDEARKLYREILKLKPDHLDSWFMLGQSFYQQKSFDKALEHYQEGLKIKPEGVNFLIQTAATLVKVDRSDEALKVLEDAIKKAGNPQLKVNLGIIRSQTGSPTEAVQAFESVGFARLENEKVLFHCAKSLVQIGRTDEGISIYERCLQLNGKHKASLNNLANIYQKIGKYSEAVTFYEKLIRHYPNEAMGYNNLAGLHEKLDDLDKSISLYRKAIEIDPELSIAWYNLAHLISTRLSRYEEALQVCKEGLQKGRGAFRKGLRYQQILLRKRLNDWSEFEKDQQELERIIQDYIIDPAPVFEIVPFDLSFSKVENSDYRKVAEKYAQGIVRSARSQFPPVSYNHALSKAKIKIGYFSSEFRKHPGGYLTRKLFGHHTSSEFEVHAFSLVHTDDSVCHEIEDSVDYYHDVSKLNSLEIANLINRTGVDILVALAGYNANMKMEVLTMRPAPIQMMILGSHQTTGAPFVDYVFSDEYMMDDQLRSSFSEKVITLPVSLLINSKLPVIEVPSTIKTDHGLPPDKFIFASFNHPQKIDPQTFDCWMEILRKTPHSVLWLYDAGSATTQKHILLNAEARSVSHERIVFAKPLNVEQHWERFKHADLFLDTFICNAHFTGIETLRLGKPILTMRGNSHNSRLCSSLLHYAGLDELVTDSSKRYVDRAIELAQKADELKNIEEKLSQKALTQLFDTELQIKYLEKGYKMALIQYKKNGQYEDLIVKSTLKYDSFD